MRVKVAPITVREATIDATPSVGTNGEYPETIFAYNHSGNVESAPVVNNDKGKLPQLSKNANSPADIRPGINSGRVIVLNIVDVFAPKSLAASSRAGSKL